MDSYVFFLSGIILQLYKHAYFRAAVSFRLCRYVHA